MESNYLSYLSKDIGFSNVFNKEKRCVSKLYKLHERPFPKISNKILKGYKTKSENIQKQVKTIGLLLDSAEGQNRNFRMEKFVSWFSKVFEVEVLQLFPLRGHSCSQYT